MPGEWAAGESPRAPASHLASALPVVLRLLQISLSPDFFTFRPKRGQRVTSPEHLRPALSSRITEPMWAGPGGGTGDPGPPGCL